MTTEDILSFLSTGEPKVDNGIFTIDANTRQIQVPDKEKIFGVQSDGYSERKYFGVQRQLTDDMDIAECTIKSIYKIVDEKGKEQARGIYTVNDIAYNDKWASFSLLFPWDAFLAKGTIYFILSIRYYNEEGELEKEWNTTIAKGTVLEGISSDFSESELNFVNPIYDSLINEFTDELNNLKDNASNSIQQIMTESVAAIEKKGQETLENIPEDYTALDEKVDSFSEEVEGEISELKKTLSQLRTDTYNFLDNYEFGNIYVKVVPNESYYVTQFVESAYSANLTDTDKKVITTLGSIFSKWNDVVTIPDNCYYIAFNFSSKYANAYIGYKDNYDLWTNGKKLSIKNEIYIPNVNELDNKIDSSISDIKSLVFDDYINLIDNSIITITTDNYKYRKFKVSSGCTYYYNQLASGISAWIDVFDTDNVRLGNAESILGLFVWDTTVTIPDGVGYIRILADSNDAYADTMYFGYPYMYDMWKNGKRKVLNNDIYLENIELLKIGLGTSLNIKDGFEYAREKGMGVIISPGTYNLNDLGYTIDDLGLKAPKIIYGYGVIFTLDFPEYTTSDPNCSAINIDKMQSCEIYGLTIKCRNARYCIHDELYDYDKLYHHVFKDLTLIHVSDTSTTGLWVAPRTIGGGIGNGGFIEIVNCQSYSNAYEDINYHSNALGSQTSEVIIMIKDCALRKGASISPSGSSTDYMNKMIVTNCISGKNVPDSTERNIKKISWNNYILSVTEFDTLFQLN